MIKYFIGVIFLYFSGSIRGNNIEIRCHIPQAIEVTMIWGVNDWNTSSNMPEGTIIKDKVMHSPMVKEGEDYVLKTTLPESGTIDYIFEFTKIEGPFKIRFDYLDINEQPDNKFYHSVIKGDSVIRVTPDLNKVRTTTQISELKYSGLLFLVFTMLALLVFVVKKYISTTPSEPTNPTKLFLSMSLTLLCIMVIIRAIITGGAVQFLITPMHSLPLLFKTSFQDFIYAFLLTLLFGFFFLVKKIRHPLILWLFGSFSILSIVVCMANIKITALLGRPFTYQWLYYSDLLNSRDATEAISANIGKKSMAAYLLLGLTTIPLTWLIYQLLIKKTILPFVIIIACIGIGYFANADLSIDTSKRANPVIYFLSSLSENSGLSELSNKNGNNQQEALIKNKNVMQPEYAAKFCRNSIKNVIVFVLESTPSEYVTPYNSKYGATPFLDSIKSSAVLFDAVYAHAPATNKSLVSIICGVYPYLSYKSLTLEKPGIEWPSIPSELKKSGYRTSFFNSGDNRFQGAENFLKHRGIDEIEDYRVNPSKAHTFSDIRYSNESLEGIVDSNLSVKFFNWIKNNESIPFFSMMWTYQTHYPYYSDSNRIDFHTNNESKEKYLNALHHADETIQQLVEGLKNRDLLKSTLIVVLGDHGEAFGRHGQIAHAGGIYEENLHIPLILINAELFNGEHINEVGGISDVAPTIFAILNKPIPDAWQGENLFSVNRRKKVYFFSPYSDYLFGFREGNYKFIYNATSNVSALYDLKIDPHESINIADKHPQYIEEAKRHINAWMQYQSDYVNYFLR